MKTAVLLLSGLLSLTAFSVEAAEGKNWYFQPVIEVVRLDLPNYSPIALRKGLVFQEHLELDGGDLWGPNFGFTLGKKANSFLGREGRFAYELKVNVLSEDTTTSRLYDFSSDLRLSWFPLTKGAGIPGFGFGGGDDVFATVERESDIYDLKFLFKYGSSFMGHTLEYHSGINFMRIKDHFNLFAYEVQTPVNDLVQDEKVTSDYYGLVFGAVLADNFCDKLGWEVGGSFCGYLLHAGYQGDQISTGSTFTGWTDSISVKDKKTTYGGSLDAKLHLYLAKATITLGAGTRYLADVAGIEHGSKFSTALNGSDAHLVFENSLMYNVGLEFAVPF